MFTYLLDTNAISRILRKRDKEDLRVAQQLQKTLRENAVVLICRVVFYEIRRGLLWRGAHKQLRFFEALCSQFHWEDFERKTWENAAELWAHCMKAGQPHGDADILIAAQARQLNAIVVTNNVKDFEDLGVSYEDWENP